MRRRFILALAVAAGCGGASAGVQGGAKDPSGRGGDSGAKDPSGSSGSAGGAATPVGGAAGATTPLGDGGAAGAPPPGPTRLQPRQLEADGAPPLVLGIWDTQEQVHCRFVVADDGQLRCLPDQNLVYSEDVYADSNCQQAARRNLGSETGPLSVALTSQGCGPIPYQALRPLPAGTPVYKKNGSSCDRDQNHPDAISYVPDSAARWEPGTETKGPRLSDRLRVVEIVAADGAHFHSGYFDDRWNAPCDLQIGTDADSCRPATASVSYFTDDMCATPASLAAVGACDQPAFLVGPAASFAFGDPYVGAKAYGLDAKNRCQVESYTGADGPNAPTFFRVGQALTDAIASVHETMIGTGTVQARGFVGDDGEAIVRSLYDSVAGQRCMPVWTTDGRVRCVATSIDLHSDDVIQYFADAACSTTPIFNTAPAADTAVVVRTQGYGWPIATAVLRSFMPFGTKTAYLRTTQPAACTAAPNAVPSSSWVPTETVPLDTFMNTLPELHEQNPLPIPP